MNQAEALYPTNKVLAFFDSVEEKLLCLMLAMMSATAFTSPKRSRSEHWPLDGRIS